MKINETSHKQVVNPELQGYLYFCDVHKFITSLCSLFRKDRERYKLSWSCSSETLRGTPEYRCSVSWQ